QSTNTSSGFNSTDGAAVLDNIRVNSGAIYDFETAGSIVARSLIPNLALDNGPWATTGKPPSAYFHVQNLNSVPYENLCGAPGSPTTLCNLGGNVLSGGNHD